MSDTATLQKSGRSALVTGAAHGLGRAIASRLAQDGLTVVIADIKEEAARNAAQEITESGGQAIALALDVTDEHSVAEIYAQVQRRFGGLDILVNNAGISGARCAVEDMSLADWELTLRVNLTGTFLMSRGAIPLMKARQWGRIVNISSEASRGRTGVGKSHYAASKSGMNGFARVMADEVGRYGITVNSVAPSRTITEMTLAVAKNNKDYFEQGIARTALGRLAVPPDIANVVAFLCSDGASFLTGTVIDVSGGAFMP
jgi:3-oxoacyl-[acyl-carrier protein] reductase